MRLKSAGIEPVVIQGFSSTFLTNDAKLDAILKEDVRIIFGIFGSKGARRIFCRVSNYFENCTKIGKYIRDFIKKRKKTKFSHIFTIVQAHDRGMYGKKYQWLTVSTLKPTWWQPVGYIEPQNCTVDQYLKASQGYISIANTNLRSDDVRNAGGLVCIKLFVIL